MEYKYSETHKLNEKFRSIFGVGFKDFYDGLMSVALKHLCIDIIKFDDWLHEKHGDYEAAHMYDVKGMMRVDGKRREADMNINVYI